MAVHGCVECQCEWGACPYCGAVSAECPACLLDAGRDDDAPCCEDVAREMDRAAVLWAERCARMRIADACEMGRCVEAWVGETRTIVSP